MTIKKKPVDVVKTDVLVIGGGGAGMMAALEAHNNGCEGILVDKGIPSRECATIMAKQLAAAGPWSYPFDSPEKHMRDTLESGCFINNMELVDLFVNQAAPTILCLEEMGMLFQRDQSGETFLSGGQPPGHSYPRSLFYGEITGKMIIDTLRRNALKQGITLLSDILVTRLLVEDARVKGALAWNVAHGDIQVLLANAVILATGGCGQLYPITSNPLQSTGEGYCLGFEAGAELMDMEMFQFFPISLVYPEFLRGLNMNIRGRLLNSNMERFMEKTDPVHLENVTRDKLAQAVYWQIKKGLHTTHGGVYLDASGFAPEVYDKQYPTEYNYCLEAGLDLKKDLVEVAPASHFMMGGVKIDTSCRTSVKGLFAAGEVAGGLHGANRLANNALMDIFVFGKIAGKNAREAALQEKIEPPSREVIEEAVQEINSVMQPKKEVVRGYHIKQKVRHLMWSKVGVIKEVSHLQEGIEKLKHINEVDIINLGITTSSKAFNRDIVEALEALSMAKLALIIAKSALMRKESRGAHYMEDYPFQDDERYVKNVVAIKNSNGTAEFALVPVVRKA